MKLIINHYFSVIRNYKQHLGQINHHSASNKFVLYKITNQSSLDLIRRFQAFVFKRLARKNYWHFYVSALVLIIW